MLDVLGINPATAEWAETALPASDREALGRVVEAIIARRQEARESKDFSLSDVLRDLLADGGIVVEDGSDGSTWRTDG
jgi:cysteinyl-tRNA synthetase